MNKLTISFLSNKGWTLRTNLMVKDFKNYEGEKYRICWHIKTYKLYAGFGELPCKVETVEHLAEIMDSFGFIAERDNLLN